MGHHSCCNQQKVKRGLWSPEEDDKLIRYISTHGYGCWSEVPEKAGLQRCGKSCRLRWINYLRPDIRRGRFTQEEEKLIISLHEMVGNRWAHIASHLPGRTDNEIKNYWNSWIKKKIRKTTTCKPQSTSPPKMEFAIPPPQGYNPTNQLIIDPFASAQSLVSASHQENIMFPSNIPLFMFDTGIADNNGDDGSGRGAPVQEMWDPSHHHQDQELPALLDNSNYLPSLVDGMMEPMGDESNGECFEKQELNDWVESQHYPCLLMWDNVQGQYLGGELSSAPNNMESIAASFSSS